MKRHLVTGLGAILAFGLAHGEAITATLHTISADGTGPAIGTVTFVGNRYGVEIRPELQGLTPGLHGFHLHERASCDPAIKDGEPTAGAAAGGHFDPQQTGRHAGPYGDGHLGDLPALFVADDGTANHPTLAPRLTVRELRGHSVIVHEGGDNYSDQPEKLGGGGARFACAVIPGAAR